MNNVFVNLSVKTYQKIYNLVKKIPKGKVTTYGQIAQILNLNPQVVGWALNRLAKYRTQTSGTGSRASINDPKFPHVRDRRSISVPWHRVINSKGGISTNKVLNIPLGLQKVLLEKEGIKFNKNNKINLKKYQLFTSLNLK